MEQAGRSEAKSAQGGNIHTLEEFCAKLDEIYRLSGEIVPEGDKIKATIIQETQSQRLALDDQLKDHDPFTDFKALKLAFTKCLDPKEPAAKMVESFLEVPHTHEQTASLPLAVQLARCLEKVSELIRMCRQLEGMRAVFQQVQQISRVIEHSGMSNKRSITLRESLPEQFILHPIVTTIATPPIFGASSPKLEMSAVDYSAPFGFDSAAPGQLDRAEEEPIQIEPFNFALGDDDQHDEQFMQIYQLNMDVLEDKPFEDCAFNLTMEDMRARINAILSTEDDRHEEILEDYENPIRKAMDDLLREAPPYGATIDHDVDSIDHFARSLKFLGEWDHQNQVHGRRQHMRFSRVPQLSEVSASQQHLQTLWWHQGTLPADETNRMAPPPTASASGLFLKAQSDLFGRPAAPVLKSADELCVGLLGLLQHVVGVFVGRQVLGDGFVAAAELTSLVESVKRLRLGDERLDAAADRGALDQSIRQLEEEWKKYCAILEEIKPLTEYLQEKQIFSEIGTDIGTPLQSVVKNYQVALKRLQEQHIESNDRLASLQGQLQEKVTLCEQTESKLAAALKDLRTETDQVESLSQELSAKRLDLQTTETNLSQARSSLSTAQQELENLRTELQELRSEHESTTTQLTNTQTTLQQKEQELRELQAKVELLTQEGSGVQTALNQEIERVRALAAELEAEKNEVLRLKDDGQKKSEEITHKQDRITNLEQELTNEKNMSKAEADKLNSQIQQLKTELNEHKVTITNNDHQMNSLLEQITAFEKQVKDLESKVEDLNTKISSLEAQVLVKDKEMQLKETEIARLNNDLASTKDNLEKTKADLVASQTELEKTKNTLKTTEETLKTTEDSLNKTKEKLQTTEETLKTTQADLNQTKTTLETTENKLKTAEQELISTKERLDQTGQQLSDLQSGHQKLEAKHDGSVSQIGLLSKRVAELEANKAILQGDKEKLQQDLDKMTQVKVELEQQKLTLEAKVEELKAEINELQGQKLKLEEQVTFLSKEKATLEDEVKYLKVDITTLEADQKNKINMLVQQDAHLTLLQQLYDGEIAQLQNTIVLLNQQLVEAQ